MCDIDAPGGGWYTIWPLILYEYVGVAAAAAAAAVTG